MIIASQNHTIADQYCWWKTIFLIFLLLLICLKLCKHQILLCGYKSLFYIKLVTEWLRFRYSTRKGWINMFLILQLIFHVDWRNVPNLYCPLEFSTGKSTSNLANSPKLHRYHFLLYALHKCSNDSIIISISIEVIYKVHTVSGQVELSLYPGWNVLSYGGYF